MDGLVPPSLSRPCNFRTVSGNLHRCIRCRREITTRHPPERIHATCRIQCRGLGDVVAAVLERLGITKPRVSRLIGRPCGCAQRQELLNRVGDAIRPPK